MVAVSFGVGAFVIPMSISAIYKALDFRSTLDILGVVFCGNAAAFTIHAFKKKCASMPAKILNEEEEQEKRKLLPHD